MEITLTGDLEHFVESKVKNGEFRSINEVVVQSLELLRELEASDQECLTQLKERIAMAAAQADAGDMEDVDDEILDRIRKSGMEILKARAQP